MKKDHRRGVLSALKAFDPNEKQRADQRLLQNLVGSVGYQGAETIATYLSFPHEFSTAALIEQALEDGKRVCIPKTYPHGRMVFVEYEADRLRMTPFGLLEPVDEAGLVEPSEIDLIHVPGLVFNKAGYRIGYGGGYYDRYLETFAGSTVSTIYSFQQFEFQPDAHDIPVQEVFIDELHL